jgi:hypothetical protein
MKHGSGSDAPCYPARSRGMIGYGRQWVNCCDSC